MPRFNWMIEDERNEFHSILVAMSDALRPLQLPDLEDEDMGFRFYCATGGLIGRLANLFFELAQEATENSRSEISLSDLDYAANTASFDKAIEIESPFSRNFNTIPSELVINKVMMLGKTDNHNPTKQNHSK